MKPMKMLAITSAFLITGLLAETASGHEYKLGKLEIDHPFARAMVPVVKVGGGYLTIVNKGDEPDRLLSVSSERAKTVQLHEMKMDDGVMEMNEQKDGIAIPAGATVPMQPNSDYHIMFMNVAAPFKEGEKIKATLTFEKAGKLDVDFIVGPLAAGSTPADDGHGGMDHTHMDHGK
ncbi:copper chaperone PCu(A)C [Allorhizobium undicola]|uniref:copper chaperone PCu(A)C n=1 Tax=Allorhizobium undicola TaxID=78527 RepID=UPI000486437F|nr:copper chaperone PCu(A)C [Allorhizobium undicola]